MLRAGENVLSFPSEVPAVDVSALSRLKPRAGEYFAVLDPPRERTDGGIMLRVVGNGWDDKHTEAVSRAEKDWSDKCEEALRRIAISKADPRSLNAKQLAVMACEIAQASYAFLQKVQDPENPGAGLETRPDSYTVAAVGDGVPLSPGDRVMIAPYAARRLRNLFDVPDVVLVGREDPWGDITVLIYDFIEKVWEPLSNWVGVQVIAKKRGVETTRRTFTNLGKVLVAGPDASVAPGEFVALHKDRTVHRPDDTKWFASKHGPFDGMGVLFVREADSDGVRRLLAVIEIEDGS